MRAATGRSVAGRVLGYGLVVFGVDALGFFELVLEDDDAAGGLDGGALVDEFAGAGGDAQLVAGVAAVAAYGTRGGALVPYRTRAPKKLLHHLPALTLRRPSVSAGPTGMLSGVRGSRLLDRRPPHYRCPAVPGLSDSARAILMVCRSSVSSLLINYLPIENCVLLVAWTSATLRQPAPSPILRLPWLGTPLPNLPARAPAADAFTEEPLNRTAPTELPLRYCSRRPLITAGPPVRSSVPSPSCNRSGFETPPPHRPASCNLLYHCPPVHLCRALLDLGYERNHNHATTRCLPRPT